MTTAVPFAELLLEGARTQPDRACVVVSDQRRSYGELATRARAAGRSLLALGVQRNDRVGILMANCLDYVEVLFGASLIGAVPVLYNARFKAREIAHVTSDAGVRVVITNDIVEQHTDYVDLLCRALPGLEDGRPPSPIAISLASRARSGFLDRAAFAALADGVDESAIDERHRATRAEDVAVMFYTSGTTAMPKGCPLSHVVLQHAGVVGGRERLGLRDGDILWGPLPMFHTGFTQPLSGVLSVGGTFLSMTHFDAGEALAMIRREQPAVMFPAFPTITTQLLNHPDYDRDSFASVRTIVNVGPPDVLRAMQERMPHTTQLSVFGMTETGGSVSICHPDAPLEQRLTSSGTVLAGDELRIVDPTNTMVAPGQLGEIVVRGRGVFSGYHNDPVKTAEAIDTDGWFHTGDLGALDDAGYLTFHGRLKDMLKVGGENVAAVEVEGFLATHPGVNLAQVVGIPDPKYDEVPVAFVELLPGASASEQEIIEFCRGEIASFKIPRHVRFVTQWPMGATKILKYVLRERICAELGIDG